MDTLKLIKELSFKAIRSSGAGGQHINKVSSKVVLSFNISSSLVLTDKEKRVVIQLTFNQTQLEPIDSNQLR